MDAQVCFLKVLFITWIDYFFHNSTEISSDGRLRTFRSMRSFQSIVRSFHKIVSSFHKKGSSFHI